MKGILKLDDKQLVKLINNRWQSSETLWNLIKKVYQNNTDMYEGAGHIGHSRREDRRGDKVSTNIQSRGFFGVGNRRRDGIALTNDNRIFVNTESVINTLIANPPVPNMIPARDEEDAKQGAALLEKYLTRRYEELNTREEIRKGLRFLYFTRLMMLKVFWNSKINDFDVKAVDPRFVRVAEDSTDELSSHFAIEEIEDSLLSLVERFPKKEQELLKENGFKTKDDLLIKNPKIKYQEAWIGAALVVKYKNIILSSGRNPYWDWDGLLVTKEELDELDNEQTALERRKGLLQEVRGEQETRIVEQADEDTEVTYETYRFNYFDVPRKPYIFATILNDEEAPVGRTSFIEQSTSLQMSINRRKHQIDRNADMMNGVIKVDSSVMKKKDALVLPFNPKGVIWGKGVQTGVSRETGVSLPNFIFEDMQDSRTELDNIMAASSAFRGEREGQETLGGRLALIERSFFRLNELVQTIDYVSEELFGWWMQMMKTRYTERHYAKDLGDDNALQLIELMQDDIEDGIEVRVISGKTLPMDKQFKFERAQADFAAGAIGLPDYLEEAGYDSPQDKARNAVEYTLDPAAAVGLSEPAAGSTQLQDVQGVQVEEELPPPVPAPIETQPITARPDNFAP